MRVITLAVALLTVYLAVDSAPLDQNKDRSEELPQQIQACKDGKEKILQKVRQGVRECAKYLTEQGKTLARHVRENVQFNAETVEAAKELADGEIRLQGRTKAEKKVEDAEKLALFLSKKGYQFRVDPHGSKADVMLPFEAYKENTPAECKTLITGFVERNIHTGRSD